MAKPLKTTKPFRLFEPRNSNVNDPGHLPNLQLSSPVLTANGTIFLHPIDSLKVNVAKRAIGWLDDERCATARNEYRVTTRQPVLEDYSYCRNDDLIVVCSYANDAGRVVNGDVEFDCLALHGRCQQEGDYPFSTAACVREDQVAQVEVEMPDEASVGTAESGVTTISVRSKAESPRNTTAIVRSWMADTGDPVGVGTTTFVTSTPDRNKSQVVNATGVYSSKSEPALLGPGDGFDIVIEPPKAFPAALATIATIVFEISLLFVP